MKDLLPPGGPAPRPFPWRLALSFFLPAAALAAATGLQRAWEGPAPTGDALLRWLAWSGGAGLFLGGVVALARRSLSWAAYGALSPLLAVALVAAGAAAARPLRERIADRREASCLESGRKICTVREFRARCSAGDAGGLGPPLSKSCGGGACVSRWLYAGPFRPDNYLAPGSLLCSMVIDPTGRLARASIIPAYDPD